MKDKPELPTSLTLDNFQKGQAEPADIQMKFFDTVLYGSQDTRCLMPLRLQVDGHYLCHKISPLCDQGKTKPTKHLRLGLGIKNLTGSRRMIEILYLI